MSCKSLKNNNTEFERFWIFRLNSVNVTAPFEGIIKEIPQNIFTPGEIQTPVPKQEAFYLVKVELKSQFVTVSQKEIFLKSGMLLKAGVQLEQRSLIEWVLDPILSLKGKLLTIP